jgi:hypothetical protein
VEVLVFWSAFFYDGRATSLALLDLRERLNRFELPLAQPHLERAAWNENEPHPRLQMQELGEPARSAKLACRRTTLEASCHPFRDIEARGC